MINPTISMIREYVEEYMREHEVQVENISIFGPEKIIKDLIYPNKLTDKIGNISLKYKVCVKNYDNISYIFIVSTYDKEDEIKILFTPKRRGKWQI